MTRYAAPSQPSAGDAYAAVRDELARRRACKFGRYFPDEGPLRRDLYVKHTQFFAAGAHYNERLFMAANQVGKTEAAAYELTCHLTGAYPAWWAGRRFEEPTSWWVAGDTMESTRDILQVALMGAVEGVKGDEWTGMLPRELVSSVTRKSGGIPLCLHQVWVRHTGGGLSTLEFKSYDQGRKVFQGTAKHGIWLDEEPPAESTVAGTAGENDIYTESLLRTITTNCLVIATFTPLRGLTRFIEDYIHSAVMADAEGGVQPAARGFWEDTGDVARQASAEAPVREGPLNRFLVGATWDDAPHLGATQREALWHSIPAYQRDARTKGIPQLGSGAIYPFSETELRVSPFELPDHWPRGFGLDAQPLWKSSVVGALDRETDTLYITDCFKRPQCEPAVHVQALHAIAPWLPGVGDAAGLVKDAERTRYLDVYRQLGLDMEMAQKGVESGIQAVYDRMSTGRLKVFASCQDWFAEFRLYRRDDRGRIVKKNDHLMDAMQYLVTGVQRMRSRPTPVEDVEERQREYDPSTQSFGWMR